MTNYTHDILTDMIQEVEREFPLETSCYPTNNIRELIENPDYPDDEGRECGTPFLNQRWIDVPAIQWYDNAEFVSFATSNALAYFLPSIMRFSYLEEISNEEKRMGNTMEWMMNILIVDYPTQEFRNYVIKRVNKMYHSYTGKQLELVKKWILFQNEYNDYDSGCANALALVDRAREQSNR